MGRDVVTNKQGSIEALLCQQQGIYTKTLDRRQFIKMLLFASAFITFPLKAFANPVRKPTSNVQASVFRALNGSPEDNILKVIDLIGGIKHFIGVSDIVVIKPNVQWWNQGAPNLLSLRTFVDVIMNQPGGFFGEVVIAENCHRGVTPWEHSGWVTPFNKNSDIMGIQNYNGLCMSLKQKYDKRFSTCHWIDVRDGGRRVFSPDDGAGYVYCDGTGGVPLFQLDNGANGVEKRSVIMTYPIFKTDRGTVIDFKNGIWEKGSYTRQPIRFINFSALNHHSSYCGATSAVKNYLGISDLSGGADPYQDGRLTEKYYNFHSFPFNKWSAGPVAGMLGSEIGAFMNSIRKADLNITTADWVGLASRTEPPVSRTKAVLASTDPVALDYHAMKYFLYPNSKIRLHNPDDSESPLRQYLLKCAEHGRCIFDERHVAVKSYDFKTNRLQKDDELVVKGNITWGRNLKSWMKYFVLRSGMV